MPRVPVKTYSMHGGAGAILSAGLLQALSFEAFEDCVLSTYTTGIVPHDKPYRAFSGLLAQPDCLWSLHLHLSHLLWQHPSAIGTSLVRLSA